MLIKVSKDLTSVTAIENGEKYTFGLTMVYHLRSRSADKKNEKRVANEIGKYLSNHNVKAGKYIFVTEHSERGEYRKIAESLADKTIGEISAYLADFNDEELQKVCSELFDIVARRMMK